MVVPVIDLFAGPGGLSEGFEQYIASGGSTFRCVLSIEKERYAHQTLLLRTFFRQFKKPPEHYYKHLRRETSLKELYKKYPAEYAKAEKIAVRLTLASRSRDKVDDLIRKALAGRREWILIGGPPCQAYSLAGRVRIRAQGNAKFENDRRHFLYREYLRIVRKFKPPVFVMENVKGLLSSSAKGVETFRRILDDFADAGYSIHSFTKAQNRSELAPEDYVIEAENYGVPQARHRVILLGLRKGIERGSAVVPSTKKIAIQAAIGDLPRIRSRISPPSRDSYENWEGELERLRSVFTGDGRLKKMNGSRRVLSRLSSGASYIAVKYPKRGRSKWLRKHDGWFIDRRLKGVTLHESRNHMPTDLRRYLFASHYAFTKGVSPKISHFSFWQRPNHENLKDETLETIPFRDRFRVQLRGRPSTTVVSHISKDGHYYIHYDPTQCRSLTVREAARLQTFPDNYYFEGTRTAQYQQIGNAVPPLLAKRMARIVYRILDRT